MRKITLFFAALCCATALLAETEEITSVSFSLDLDLIDYYKGNTEGNVRNRIREHLSFPADANYTINTSNSGLSIKHGIGDFWGIGSGEESISETKTYAICVMVNPKTDVAFPSDMSTIKYYFNGEEIVPDFVDASGVESGHIRVYVLLGTPDEAPATTYALTLVNVDKYGYVGQTYEGGDFLEGAEAKFQAKEPAKGAQFDKWVAEGLTLTAEQEIANPLTIVMPANDVTITATYSDIEYSITCNPSVENGTIEVDKTTAIYGEEVTITVTPAAGYELVLGSLEAYDASYPSQKLVVTDNKFIMSDYDVIVTAEFKASTPTALEQVSLNSVEVRDGRVYCDGEFRIYDTLGRDVTRMNGKLNGVYVVRCGEKSAKVVVR